MDNIRWLFFDLGSTLVDEEKAHRQRIISTVNSNPGVSFEDLYHEMIKASKAYKQPYPTAVKALNIADKQCYPKELEELYDDTLSVLQSLHKKFKIGIIANQSAGSEDRIKNWRLIDYIDFVFASAEVGMAKPDVRFFEYALNKTGASPKHCVMIGDRLDNDIFPAKKAGMKTIWIKQGFGAFQDIISFDYQPDFIITGLKDLIDLLL